VPDQLKFLHPVGPSTFKYGITIPVAAQTARYLAIGKGEKVAVTLFCEALPLGLVLNLLVIM
jgi:hypothetical protein